MAHSRLLLAAVLFRSAVQSYPHAAASRAGVGRRVRCARPGRQHAQELRDDPQRGQQLRPRAGGAPGIGTGRQHAAHLHVRQRPVFRTSSTSATVTPNGAACRAAANAASKARRVLNSTTSQPIPARPRTWLPSTPRSSKR